MKSLVALCVSALLFAGSSFADEKKIDDKKIVGKWELTKSSDEGAPKGAIVEFTKDGKLTITIDFNGKKIELGGKYTVKGDKLTVTVVGPDGGEGKEQTDSIKELTDDKLVIEDSKKKETEFKKKK